jgi:hypothetical protein
MEAEVVDERERCSTVEVGTEKRGTGRILCLVSEFENQALGLLGDPPTGRREDEADSVVLLGHRLEMEK